MKTIINWNKTSDGLPEPKITNCGVNAKTGKNIIVSFDEACLVIWKGKVKPSQYLSNQQRWEGHTDDQTPEYWIKIKDLEIIDE